MRRTGICSSRLAVGFLSILGTLVVTSCTSGEEFLFLSTPYFEAAFPDSRATASSRLSDIGLDFQAEIVEPELSSDSFMTFLNRTTAEFIFATPFLADKIASAAPVFRDRRFLVLYADQLTSQENIQRLATDRSASYHAAGRLAAAFLADAYEREGSDDGVKMLILVLTDSDRRQREFDTFIEGYSAEIEGFDGDADIEEPVIELYTDRREGRNASRLVNNSADEYRLVFASLGAMNVEVMNAAGETGVAIITESIGVAPVGGVNVIAYINEDWLSGIEMAIESRNPRVVIPSTLEIGPGSERFDLSRVMRFF
jgi:hypothetical protein